MDVRQPIQRESVRVLRSRLGHIMGALRLIWEAAGFWMVAWASLLIIQGVLPAAVVYTTKWVVDSVAAALGGGLTADNLERVFLPAGIMAVLLLLQQIMQSLGSWVQTAQSELVQDQIKALIQRKAVEVDYGFYESSEFFDKLQEASAQSSTRALGLLQNIGTLTQNGITFLSIAAILASYSLWLPVALLIGTLPALYVVVLHNRRYHTWWKETTRDRRWASYLDVLFVEPRFAAEMRLYDLGDYFMEAYREVRGRLRGATLELSRKQTIATLFAGIQALLVTAAVLGWMVWRGLRGQATLGDIALFYQAINQGQSLMRTLLTSVGQIYTNTLFLEHLFEFLALQPELMEPEVPAQVPAVRHGVTFEDVTFTYPGNAKPALNRLTLDLPAGKIVAVVGANGAGKSTLSKLLCRFYDPDSGRILIDGIDIRNFSKRDLLDLVSVMFQYPVHYQATAYENIALSDRRSDAAAVRSAARSGGAQHLIESMPKGYETILGRLFPEGTELSGGEWQRIALARAYLRQTPIIVLDEPTSAMDSWTEVEWMSGFKELARGKTVLVITHRFTTAMQADVIYVMEGGRVVEAGTHSHLLSVGGRYATSWTAQMRMADDLLEDAV